MSIILNKCKTPLFFCNPYYKTQEYYIILIHTLYIRGQQGVILYTSYYLYYNAILMYVH